MVDALRIQNGFLDALEKRIEKCEKSVGIGPSTTPDKGEASLFLEIFRLQQKLTNVCQGNFAEFEEKYKHLKSWLDDEHVSGNTLLLSLQAKKELVLQHEEMLCKTAAHLRHVQQLQQYVNPPELSGIEAYRERILQLEQGGNALTLRVLALQKKIQDIAETYSTVVNMTSALFNEWHDVILKCENKDPPSSIEQ